MPFGLHAIDRRSPHEKTKMLKPGFLTSMRRERGIFLLEAVVALAITGTFLTGVVVVMGASVRTSARAQESVTLAQLVRAQIETIQQSPFKDDPTQYPAISAIPEGFTVAVTSTDPGTSYSYAAPSNTTLTSVVQQIEVKATGDFSEMSMTFYKIKVP